MAQTPSGGFPNVLGALGPRLVPGARRDRPRAAGAPGGFAGKKALVDWYHSEAHQKVMKSVFLNQTFDRQPLPTWPRTGRSDDRLGEIRGCAEG
jgi:hypothetical protein